MHKNFLGIPRKSQACTQLWHFSYLHPEGYPGTRVRVFKMIKLYAIMYAIVGSPRIVSIFNVASRRCRIAAGTRGTPGSE
eukprot:1088612-Rhodomonas_salina.1